MGHPSGCDCSLRRLGGAERSGIEDPRSRSPRTADHLGYGLRSDFLLLLPSSANHGGPCCGGSPRGTRRVRDLRGSPSAHVQPSEQSSQRAARRRITDLVLSLAGHHLSGRADRTQPFRGLTGDINQDTLHLSPFFSPGIRRKIVKIHEFHWLLRPD